MSEKWFEKLRDQLDNFLSTATNEELDAALEKADYDFYKNVKTPILGDNFPGVYFTNWSSYTISGGCHKESMPRPKKERDFKPKTDMVENPDYGYSLAA